MRDDGGKDSRSRILATAREYFLGRGYASTRLREVARASGVTTGALYHHFSGKDELFVEVCVQGVEELTRRMAEARVEEGESLTHQLTRLFDAYAGFFMEENGYYELIESLETAPRRLRIRESLLSRLDGLFSLLLRDLRRLLQEADPGRSEEETAELAALLVAMAEGTLQCVRRGTLRRLGVTFHQVRALMLSRVERMVERG